MEGVSGKKFSGYWMHGEHVLVNGRKMSKSRGNMVYVRDLLQRGYHPHHIRFYLCYGHYRKKLNLDEDRLHLARGKVDTYRQIAAGLEENPPDGRSGDRAESLVRRLQAEFEDRMNDDLDVESAFDSVYGVLAELAQMQARGSLSRADSRRAAGALKKIDTVWRFLD
jgi:cysteinyl-tRNA synthetase